MMNKVKKEEMRLSAYANAGKWPFCEYTNLA